MKILVFDTILSGHHLEYLHHLHEGARRHPDRQYVFAVPGSEWKKMQGKLSWMKAPNVEWLMLSDKDCARASQGSLASIGINTSRLICNTAKRCLPDRIFIVNLTVAIPFLPMMLRKKTEISGILYYTMLRHPRHGIRGFIDRWQFRVLTRDKNIGTVFVLNDPKGVDRLNEIYCTDRFVSLPDPVPPADPAKFRNLRDELGIPADNKVFLHFGVMGPRKGTLEILKAINKMSAEELQGKSFIFAGLVIARISKDYHKLLNECKEKGAQIITVNRYCSFEYLHSLCHTADCLLIPYLFPDLSSGVIGYGAIHGVPVIGPGEGLIGELIRDNDLGITIDEITPETLRKAMAEFQPYKINSPYAETNSVEAFINTIMK